MYGSVVVKYEEISLKKGKRAFFERILLENIKKALEPLKYENIKKEYGRIVIEFDDTDVSEKDFAGFLEKVPGISNFSFVLNADRNMISIREKVLEAIDADNRNGKTFKIQAKRIDKSFGVKSMDMNAEIGEFVMKERGLAVDVKNPDLRIRIDILRERCLIYTGKAKGVGGLPVGSSGKLVSMISGGIDSPVAGFMMAKRGAKVIFAHFQNMAEYGENKNCEKIEKLVSQIAKFQGESRLYVVPFEKVQEEVLSKAPHKQSMLLFKRAMFRIVNEIARREGAKGFVMGDSLSQVASQTLENANVIYDAAEFPVFSPLIGMNKTEIIEIARKIGTFDISSEPYYDCFLYKLPKHPETKADLEDIEKMEEKLDLNPIISGIIADLQPLLIRPVMRG
ncbi:MAG: tRNA 4-thiouridine(8) synthase ThiI [Candidatus Pacebacteria bacterium]|nr:tRNA 4-thiouridine(8) synthase ThiI [Candidatus Paceibacterota bacterium]